MIQKSIPFFLLIFLGLNITSFGQDTTLSTIKKGWNVGPLPALGYDSDRGMLLGVLGEVYYFGDGSLYPDHFHKLKMETSFYTGGSANIQLYYDSKYLIRNTRVMFEVGYFPDAYYDFYGLNAYSYPQTANQQSKLFNKVERNLFRFQSDFQRKIIGNLYWAGGVSFQSYHLKEVEEKDAHPEQTLFDLYKQNNLLTSNELNGGNHILLKLGVIYDTRNFEPDPSRGFCSEFILGGAPDILDKKGFEHLRLTITHRHFFTLLADRLVLAGRIGLQQTLVGDVPFYLLQNINTFFQKRIFNEGLGGASSIRGVFRNRIVSDGVGWANVEFRYKLYSFKWIGQNWYVGVNPFFDAGMILATHNKNEFAQVVGYENPINKLHTGVGMGLKIVMNQNFIISADFGKSINEPKESTGLYVLLNYIF